MDAIALFDYLCVVPLDYLYSMYVIILDIAQLISTSLKNINTITLGLSTLIVSGRLLTIPLLSCIQLISLHPCKS